MTESRKQALKDAYTRLHAAISALYDEDPEGMGVTTASPEDEYSAEATKLILHLQAHRHHEDVAPAVRRMYPGATQSLIDRVRRAWADFLQEVQ